MRLSNTLRHRFQPSLRLPLFRVFTPYILTSVHVNDRDVDGSAFLNRDLPDLGLPICRLDGPEERHYNVLAGPIY